MAKNFMFITLAVTCILLQTTHAASFECAAEPAICKTKFTTQFENDFKDMHLIATRQILSTFIQIGNIIKSKSPANSPLTAYLSERISITSRALDKINEHSKDTNELLPAIVEGMKTLDIDFRNLPTNLNEKEITKEHGFPDSPAAIVRKLEVDAGILWAKMYKDLREADLKTYPEYAEVNVHMEILRNNSGHATKRYEFMQAAEILGTKFNSSYFAELFKLYKTSFVI